MNELTISINISDDVQSAIQDLYFDDDTASLKSLLTEIIKDSVITTSINSKRSWINK